MCIRGWAFTISTNVVSWTSKLDWRIDVVKRTVEDIKDLCFRQRSYRWHLMSANDLNHQRLLYRLKLFAHHYLIIVAVFHNKFQTIFLNKGKQTGYQSMDITMGLNHDQKIWNSASDVNADHLSWTVFNFKMYYFAMDSWRIIFKLF